MYKTASEVMAALAVPYNGPTYELDGFTYIKSKDSVKAMDEVFGPLGWSEEVLSVSAHPVQGIYIAAMRVTGYFVDDTTGEVRSISRSAVGRSTAPASKDEKAAGLTVTESLKRHDTAAAAAESDAFSRLCKHFGPALGSLLRDGETSGSSRPASSDLGSRPSEKQMPYLIKAGLTAEMVAAMPFKEWKAALDAYFAKPKEAAAKPVAKAKAPAAEPGDYAEIPF